MEFQDKFCGFAGIFEGGFRKTVDLMWCFGGEFVVDRMAGVVVGQPTFCGRKMCQVLQLYF
jgi:hypothetical protein